MLVVLLTACTPPGAEGATDAAAAPTAWEWAPPDTPAPTLLDVDGVGSAVDEAVAAIVVTRPRTVLDAFQDALFHHADATCPEVVHGPQTVVSGDCTTADGWSWYGLSALTRITNLQIVLDDIDNYHRVWDFETGNARAEGPAGERYDMLGYTWYRDYDDDAGYRALAVELWGEFAATGVPSFADTWMADGWDVELYADLEQRPEGNEGTWSGGMSRLDGLAWAFVIDDIALSEAACAREPTGSVEVQDQAGTWYTIAFDGDVSCDGCGAVTVDGAALGTACADFTPLAVWEDSPWDG